MLPCIVTEMSRDAQLHTTLFTCNRTFNYFDLPQLRKFPAPPLMAWTRTDVGGTGACVQRPWRLSRRTDTI